MTDESIPTPDDDNSSASGSQETKTPVSLTYTGASHVESTEESAHLSLFGDLKRDPVSFQGKVKHPQRFREALGTLYGIVKSDFRYVPKDRTRYIAYQQLKRQSANLGLWQAQQAYFDWLFENDPLAWLILDPIITVHPDEIFFEVFSKDEGSYARLSFSHDAFESSEEITCGTTNIDFSETLNSHLEQMRSYRETTINIGQQEVKVETTSVPMMCSKSRFTFPIHGCGVFFRCSHLPHFLTIHSN